jgi:hypothetical protein
MKTLIAVGECVVTIHRWGGIQSPTRQATIWRKYQLYIAPQCLTFVSIKRPPVAVDANPEDEHREEGDGAEFAPQVSKPMPLSMTEGRRTSESPGVGFWRGWKGTSKRKRAARRRMQMRPQCSLGGGVIASCRIYSQGLRKRLRRRTVDRG